MVRVLRPRRCAGRLPEAGRTNFPERADDFPPLNASEGGAERLEFGVVTNSPLSTALPCGPSRGGSGTEVASTDEIHRPVENSRDTQKPRNDEEADVKKPPGQFVNDELEEQTMRFLEEVKGLAKRRRKASEEDQLGPPPSGGRQRSSRR